jgi:biopolymer transport protein ExbD
MKLKTRRTEEPEINVTSLIDVVLLLVVFFMLSSNFTSEGRLQIHLPQAAADAAAHSNEEAFVVTVTSSGSYLVNGRELVNSSPDTLRAAILKATSAGAHPAAVTIRADGRATHQSVVTAMDVLGRLGFTHMNVATVQDAGAPPP